MSRLLKFSYERAIPALFLIGALTLVLGFSGSRVRVDVSSDQLLPKTSPLLEEYERVRDTFGSDTIAAVYLKDHTLFTHNNLQALTSLNERLLAIPEVERIDSLVTVSHIQGEDGWLKVGPLLDDIPEDPDALQKIKKEATSNPILLRTIISKDGRATLLTLYLSSESPTQKGVATRADTMSGERELKGSRAIFSEIEEVLDEFRDTFDEIYQIGSPALQVRMFEYIVDDQILLMPLTILLISILMGVALQNRHMAIVPVLNAIVGSIWTLGLIALFDIPVNMLNYVVPAIILVVGATEDIHLLVEFQEAQLKGKSGSNAIILVGQKIGLTLFLTACSTILGFAAIGLTSIPVMRQFGITAALGMGCRFITTLTLLPAYLRIFESGFRPASGSERENYWAKRQSDRLTSWVMRFLVTRPFAVISVFLLIAAPSIFFASKIDLNNDLMAFLRPESTLVKRIETVSEKLSGPKVIYLTLKGAPGDFKEHNNLQELFEISNALRSYEEFDSVVSLADYISLVNQEMHDGDPSYFSIPDNDSLIAQYLLFFHRSDIESFVNSDFSQANVVMRTGIKNSTRFNALVSEISEMLDSGKFGPQVYVLTGKSLLVSTSVDKIVTSQITSLSSITVLLFIVVSTLFISLRCGLLAVLANLFSIAVGFGIMGILDVPLNVGTCMVAAITVGIGVDDTLHLMVRYNRELKNLKDEKRAIERALRSEMLPVLVTSLGLAGGFLVLAFSSFVPVQQFGVLSALVIGIAVISDLILTPVLLFTVRLITLWDLLEFPLRKALREKSRLFEGMSRIQVKQFILLSQMVEYKAGAQIIKEGEWGNDMYIVIEGELEVSKDINGKKTVLNALTLGDAFGEIALVARSRRTADIVALTDAKLLSIDWDSLVKIRYTAPLLASRIYLNLARILGMRFVQTVNRLEQR